MIVHCGKCGAELLGAVNRCWKCGQSVVSRPDAATVPPLRRPPVAGPLQVAPWEALQAVILDLEPPAATGEPTVAAAEAAAASEVREGQPASPATAPRRGSPFAHGAALHKSPASGTRPADLRVNDVATLLEVERPRSALERWTPIAAICLGAGSFGLGDYPEVALGFALIGTAFSAVAVLNRVKLTSVAGIVICVAALFWSGYSTAVAVYERTFGVSPWVSTEDGFEPAPLDDTAP